MLLLALVQQHYSRKDTIAEFIFAAAIMLLLFGLLELACTLYEKWLIRLAKSDRPDGRKYGQQ